MRPRLACCVHSAPWPLLILLGLLVISVGAAAGPQSIDLATAATPLSLDEVMWIHKAAAQGDLAPGEVAAILASRPDAWEMPSVASRSSYFKPATLWLLSAVHNGGDASLTRWLTVETWRLRDVQLFVIDPDSGAILSHQRAGLREPLSKRAIPTVGATFPLRLAPGERRWLLVRLQDKTFGPIHVQLHEPEFRQHAQTALLYYQIALLGFMLALVVVLLVQLKWPFALVALWLGALVLFELSYQVPLILTLFPALTPHIVPFLTLAAAFSFAAFGMATPMFLWPRSRRLWYGLYAALSVAILGAASATLWSDQPQLARAATNYLALLILLVWPLVAWSSWRDRQRPYQRVILSLFALYWATMTLRALIAAGLIHTDAYTDPGLLLYLITMVAVALGILGVDTLSRRNAQRAAERAMQAREESARRALVEMQQQENIRLTAAVEERTRALREAIARAEESSRAKSVFLSTVSHELRAPLHDILGYAQLLVHQVPPQAQERLDIIQGSGQQLLHFINDILEFSRGEAKPIALEPAPLSLTALAEQLDESCRPLAADNGNALAIQVETDGLDWVMTDERRLTQILRNLLENACKFTHDGRIELGIALAEPAHPGKDAWEADVRIAFRVTDTGVGIPEGEQAAIFQPFMRLDPFQRVPGLGLGLAIAQQLAAALGGRITVRSRQGETSGTTFALTLPLAIAAPETAEAEEPRTIVGYRGQRRTVLIVDDFSTSRQLLGECCRAWGFGVILAQDGLEALARARAAQPPVDVVLTDQFMPNLDGWGLLRGLRESAPDPALPIILISAAPMEPPDDFPADMAFDRFALKPLPAPRLAQLLEEVLGLAWEYAETPVSTPDSAAPASARLADCVTAEELEAFRKMVALGQLMAIAQWTRDMAERHPRHAPLWQDIAHRCATVDLPGLRGLAE